MRAIVCIPALASVALLAACDFKNGTFFAPELTTIDRFPDTTPPLYSNYKPSAQLTGVYNVNAVSWDFTDPVPTSGIPASGIDGASLKATYGTATVLPLTRAGDTYSASLAGVSDGATTLRLDGKDNAGNAATGNITLTLDRVAPSINVTERPATSTTSNAATSDVSWKLGITDLNLMNAVGGIYRPGADNTCGTTDDVLVPKGTGPDQISENSWNYSPANAGNLMVRYTLYNPVFAGGSPMTRTHCFVVTAADNALGLTGIANPNIGRVALAYNYVWSPTPPPTGTIRGVVLKDGLPASGVVITLGGVLSGSTTTQTNSSGAYEFANVEVGIRNLGIGAPNGTVCEPSVGIATVTANNVSAVNFACNTPAGTIAGRITIAGLPLPGVTLSVDGTTQVTDADGRYLFTGLLPKQYTVVLIGIPSTAVCSVGTFLVTVTSNAQSVANFQCEAKPGTLMGVVLIEGQPAAGLRLVLNNGDFRITGADGRYEFNSINPAQYTIIISQAPVNVTCSPMDAFVQVVAGGTTVQNFACGTPVITTSYYHLTSSSVVCVDIRLHPSMGKVPYELRVTGPGVVGSGTQSGQTTVGSAFLEQAINTYGTYLANVTVNGMVMLPRQQIVTAAAGTCIPLVFSR